MTPELWKKISRTLDDLLALEPGQRHAELSNLRQSDPELAAEVESLLRQQDTKKSLDLESAVVGAWEQLQVAPTATAKMPDQIGPYAVVETLGEGGMGTVYRVKDRLFRRNLAVKVLKGTHQANADLGRRFLEEAQLMGQLQHPGIPPVHDLGSLADSRPYFAMKLIKGKTLAALLRERANAEQNRTELVNIFEQICRTMAYTHAQGIIHRDLKPANVMVGAFGEVQVMDWGLAKVLKQALEPAATAEGRANAISSVRDDAPDSWTQSGLAMGTPAYMAPEQARGEIDQLDERCDVFALGAILCEILTGQPPFCGASGRDVLRMAQKAGTAAVFARLDQCGADQELVDLTKHCLAANKENRPADGATVVRAVAGYLTSVQERLRQTELERKAAEVRALEERKRRRIAVGLAFAVVLLLLSAGGGAWWYKSVEDERKSRQERQETELAAGRTRTVRDVGQALDEADLFGKQAEELSSNPEQWEKSLGLAISAVKRAEGLLATGTADEALRLQVAKARQDFDHAERERKLILELEDILIEVLVASMVNMRKTDDTAALARYRLAYQGYGLDVLAVEPAEAARRLQSSPRKVRLVAALWQWERVTEVKREQHQLQEIALAIDADPNSFNNRWRKAIRTGERVALEALGREALGQHLPSSVIVYLARDLILAGARDTAKPLIRAGIERQPTDFLLNLYLGHVLIWEPKHKNEAVRAFTTARAVRWNSGVAHLTLGIGLHMDGRQDDAMVPLQKALELAPNNPFALLALGTALHERGRADEAIVLFEKVLKIDPKNGIAHLALGIAFQAKGNTEKAIHFLETAIQLNMPRSILTMFGTTAYTELGNALSAKKQWDEAATAFLKAIGFDDKHSPAHGGLADVLLAKGQIDKAIASYRKALEHNPQSAVIRTNLGNALLSKGLPDQAIAEYQKTLKSHPEHARAYLGLGTALGAKRQVDEAIVALRKALSYDPKLARAHANLGLLLVDKGRYDEAAANGEQAIGIDPKDARGYITLGWIHRAKKDYDSAIAWGEKAIALDPKDSMAHLLLVETCVGKQDYESAIEWCKKTINVQPKAMWAHNNMGVAYYYKQEYDEAIHWYSKVIEDNPKDAIAWANRGLAYNKKQDLEEATKQFKQAMAISPPHLNRFLADLVRVEKHQEAVTAVVLLRRFVAEGSWSPLRYNSTRAYVLAGSGRGDAAKLDSMQRLRLRKQSLEWLRDELKSLANYFEKTEPRSSTSGVVFLRNMLSDDAFTNVRGAKVLEALEPDEQKEWQQFWREANELLAKVESKMPSKK